MRIFCHLSFVAFLLALALQFLVVRDAETGVVANMDSLQRDRASERAALGSGACYVYSSGGVVLERERLERAAGAEFAPLLAVPDEFGRLAARAGVFYDQVALRGRISGFSDDGNTAYGASIGQLVIGGFADVLDAASYEAVDRFDNSADRRPCVRVAYRVFAARRLYGGKAPVFLIDEFRRQWQVGFC